MSNVDNSLKSQFEETSVLFEDMKNTYYQNEATLDENITFIVNYEDSDVSYISHITCDSIIAGKEFLELTKSEEDMLYQEISSLEYYIKTRDTFDKREVYFPKNLTFEPSFTKKGDMYYYYVNPTENVDSGIVRRFEQIEGGWKETQVTRVFEEIDVTTISPGCFFSVVAYSEKDYYS